MAKYIFWFVWFIYVEKLKALALLLRPSPRRSLFAVVNGICSTTLDRRRCLLFYCVSTMVCSSVRISPIEVIFDLDSRSTCHSRTILQNRTEKKKEKKNKLSLVEIIHQLPIASVVRSWRKVFFLSHSATNWCLRWTSCGITFMSEPNMAQKST